MSEKPSDLLRRVEKSAQRVDDLQTELRAELLRRNELSRAALDAGAKHRTVARAARIRPSTLTDAVAKLGSDGPDVVGPPETR